jgi:hypothetical protein
VKCRIAGRDRPAGHRQVDLADRFAQVERMRAEFPPADQLTVDAVNPLDDNLRRVQDLWDE